MTTSHWQGGIPFLKKTIYIEKKAVAHESRLSHLGIWPTSKMRIHPLEVVMMHEGCLYDENGACTAPHSSQCSVCYPVACCTIQSGASSKKVWLNVALTFRRPLGHMQPKQEMAIKGN